MIRDQKFWSDIRNENQEGNTLFRCFLAVLHSCQANLTVHSTNVELEQKRLRQWTIERQCCKLGEDVEEDEEKERNQMIDEEQEYFLQRFNERKEKSTLQLDSSPSQPVSSSTIRVLQRILLFAVPLFHLRYKVYAISLAKKKSCFLDQITKELIIFGSGERIVKPISSTDQGCAVGDNFYACIDSRGQVAINSVLQECEEEDDDRYSSEFVFPYANMIVANGCRLACLNKFGEAWLLSSNPYSNHSLFPSIYSTFVALDLNSDAFAVGNNSLVYKVGRKERELSSPRRVMPFSRTAISRIAAGKGFLVAIDHCGRLLMQGTNHCGVLGLGSKKIVGRRLVHISEFSHFFVQIAAGEMHALALSSSGCVYGSGSNEMGQLGMGPEKKKVLRFTRIPLPQPCDGIAAGACASAFVLRDGSVYICGDNREGQLGVSSTNDSHSLNTSTSAFSTSIATANILQGVVYEPTHVKRIQNSVAFAYLPTVSEESVSGEASMSGWECDTSSISNDVLYMKFDRNSIKSSGVPSPLFRHDSEKGTDRFSYGCDFANRNALLDNLDNNICSAYFSNSTHNYSLSSHMTSRISLLSSRSSCGQSSSINSQRKEPSAPIPIQEKKSIFSVIDSSSSLFPKKRKESTDEENSKLLHPSAPPPQPEKTSTTNEERSGSFPHTTKETKESHYPFSDEKNKENGRSTSPSFHEPIAPEKNSESFFDRLATMISKLSCC